MGALGWLLNLGFAGGGTPNTITLTDITAGKIVQRVSGVGSLTVSGTYTGTPTSIEARVVLHGTSTEVKTWTVVDAAPTGGTFSGSLTSITEGGWYNVQVRFSNDTGTTDAGTNKWGIGILIGVIGQSQARNYFTTGSGQSPDDLIRKYNELGWDVLGAASNGATAIGNTILAGLTTPVPIGLLDYGVGGTGLTSGVGGDYWLDLTAGKPWDLFLTGVTAVGGEMEGIIWCQGEADAWSGVTYSAYYTGLAVLAARLRSNITNRSGETNLPVYVSLLGRETTSPPTNGTDAEYNDIRNAQIVFCGAAADTYLAANAIPLSLADNVHRDAAGYTDEGEQIAQTILYVLGEETYYAGPTIISVVEVDSTHLDITIAGSGTDFTPVGAGAVTGFEVLDSGTPVSVTDQSRNAANVIRITHGTVSGTKTIRYQYGKNPTVTGAIVDNTAATLYLLTTDSEGITTTVSITGVSSTGSVGSLNITTGVVIQPTGVNATGNIGTITVSIAGAALVNITGVSATPAVGDIVTISGLIQNISGVSSPGNAGTLAVVEQTTVQISGVLASGQIGTININTGAIVSLTGVVASEGVGSIAVSTSGGIVWLDGTITIEPSYDGAITLN